jgi:uncharacterized membrane protein
MPTSPLHALTILAYTVHIGGGVIGLVSGTVAAFAQKGGQLHRTAGTIFVISMVVMAVFALYLAVVIPDQVNLFISVFVFYLVATAWLTIWRKEGSSGLLEKIAMLVAFILLAPFAILVFQVAIGAPTMFKSTVAFKGPVLVALYGITTVLAIAAISDAKLVLAGGISGAPRIARHLWRMCLGLTLAAGSAFTNGLPRLLPGPFHVPPEFFLPQFVPLGLLVFWLIRVRFTGWYKQASVTLASHGGS